MKGFKVGLIIITMFLAIVGLSSVALAFHDGGVAYCDGCHTMHGVYSGNTSFTGKGPSLLVATDPSSTCLLCHAGIPTGSGIPSIGGGPKVMTYPFPAAGLAPANYNVGGDFAWLQKTYGSGASAELGQTRGHNVNASDFGMLQDSDFSLSPGGSFPVGSLGCNSCHDPHGKYRRVGNNQSWTVGTPTQLLTNSRPISSSGSKGLPPTSTTAVGTYRLLAGQGYLQGGVGGILIGYPGAPLAVAPGNGSAETSSATQTRVAYSNYNGSGVVPWGQWCGSCHTGMLATSASEHKHPVDVALNAGGEDQNYNMYISSGNMNGNVSSSFLSLVPFMEVQSNVDTLTGHTVTAYVTGPAPTDQVSCPSCHRAHASGFKHMMRWNMEYEMLTVAGPVWQITTGAATSVNSRTTAEANAAYYGRTADYFGTAGFQRSLCNKCHAQD